MFVLGKSDLYFWPVKVEVAKDGGQFEKMQFDAQFRRVKQTELTRLLDATESTDDKLSRAVVKGWKGIVDTKGNEIPFTDGAFDQLLEEPRMSGAITRAFIESIAGEKLKN